MFCMPLLTHDACTSRYTSGFHIWKYLNKKGRSSLRWKHLKLRVTCQSSGSSSSVWKLHCLFSSVFRTLEKDPKKPKHMEKTFAMQNFVRRSEQSYEECLLREPFFINWIPFRALLLAKLQVNCSEHLLWTKMNTP